MIPRITAAGVLGIALTIWACWLKCFSKYPNVFPAATERKVVSLPINLLRSGKVSSIVCGLTARTTTEGTMFSGISEAVLTIVRLGILSKVLVASSLGSTTYIPSSMKRLFTQPANIAPPIFPQPIKNSGFVIFSKLPPQHQ